MLKTFQLINDEMSLSGRVIQFTLNVLYTL